MCIVSVSRFLPFSLFVGIVICIYFFFLFLSRRVVCLYHNINSRYIFKWFQWSYFCSLNFPWSLTTAVHANEFFPFDHLLLLFSSFIFLFVDKIWHSCLWHSLLSLFFKYIYVANMKLLVRNFYRICIRCHCSSNNWN